VTLPFQGETMRCVMCGRTARSSPGASCPWRAIEIHGVLYYACDGEFPPDGASAEAFTAAYQAILQRILTGGSAPMPTRNPFTAPPPDQTASKWPVTRRWPDDCSPEEIARLAAYLPVLQARLAYRQTVTRAFQASGRPLFYEKALD
jgi:hypothetical protein